MALSTKIIEVKVRRVCHCCNEIVTKGHHVLQLTTGWGANGYNANVCSDCLSKLNGEMSMLEQGKENKEEEG